MNFVYANQLTQAPYPQIWTLCTLQPGSSWSVHRPNHKLPYELLAKKPKAVFPVARQNPRLGSIEPCTLSTGLLDFLGEFTKVHGFYVYSWQNAAEAVLTLIVYAVQDKILNEDHGRKAYNKLLKLYNLADNAGTQGEKLAAMLAMDRILNRIRETQNGNSENRTDPAWQRQHSFV